MAEPITLSRHAIERAREMGLLFRDIAEVVTDPEVSYTQMERGETQVTAKRGDISVVYDCKTSVVITVLLNRQEQWDRSRDKVRR